MNNIKQLPFQTTTLAKLTYLASLYKQWKKLEKNVLPDIPCNQDLQSTGQHLNLRQTGISQPLHCSLQVQRQHSCQ